MRHARIPHVLVVSLIRSGPPRALHTIILCGGPPSGPPPRHAPLTPQATLDRALPVTQPDRASTPPPYPTDSSAHRRTRTTLASAWSGGSPPSPSRESPYHFTLRHNS